MRVLLIRHGQTDWNAQGRWQGHSDVPLNEAGLSQARALADRLVDWRLEAIYSSDLKRASMTAAIIAKGRALTPILDPAWRERDVGAFAGLTSEEAATRFPRQWAELRRGFLNPPGGEHHLDMYERVISAFGNLLASHQTGDIAVVSHGGTLSLVISHVLGLEPGKHGKFTLKGNTGLSIVESDGDGLRLTLLNDTCHLDDWRTKPEDGFRVASG